ncbi:hypothetical protein PENANT_c142G01441 [Penicillium antarcticum]|uniref:Uncharacterized protein n=1 Tax=Penicillium antarcticum TaxID=416450 RepID=A0A1V6PFS4_9EURO|nr:hypothetical protein PENANT_c142G01441 [Penicillium antarcticum]
MGFPGHAPLVQTSEDTMQAITSFLEKEAIFQRWARLYQADRSWDDDPGPPQGTRLYYACLLGLVTPVQDLIGKGANINTPGGRYDNALQAASVRGHNQIVKLLIDKDSAIVYHTQQALALLLRVT